MENTTENTNKNTKKSKPVTVAAESKPAFTLNADKFLVPDSELPSDWQSNQGFLATMYDAKNAHKDCNGFLIGQDHVTIFLRQGVYTLRTARGYGDSAGKVVAHKAKASNPLDVLMANKESILADARKRVAEHEAQIALLNEVIAKFA